MPDKTCFIRKLDIDPVKAPFHIGVLIKKVSTDGENLVKYDNHRTAITPETDLDAQLEFVNAHLTAMGEDIISNSDWNKVRAAARKAFTPQIKANYEKLKIASLSTIGNQ